MAIPTQFSVTKTRKCPIANPTHPIDDANALTAEDVGFISGASAIPTESAGDIVAPSNLTSESASDIDGAVVIGSEQQADIDTPSELGAKATAGIDTPSELSAEAAAGVDSPSELPSEVPSEIDDASLFSALSNATIDNPSVVTPEPAAPVDGASELTAKSSSEVDLPVAATSESQAGIDSPISLSTENAAVIDNPAALGAKPESELSAPSSLSAEGAPSVAEPSALSAESSPSIQVPSMASAESQPTIAAPSSLTANAGTKVLPPFPLNHARILYVNKLQQYNTITASNEVASNPVINALKPNTHETWRFTTSSSVMQVDFGGPTQSIDMLCIGSHNLHRAGATIEVWYEPEPGGTFVQFDVTKEPEYTESQPIVFYSETAVDALTIEVRITGATGVPTIGYISAGIALQMQRPFFNGHTPINDADVTEYYSNRSESGEIIGQMIRRQGYETTAEWQNIDDTWYRSFFAPFKQAAKLNPFFFCWNLLEYPEDTGFCRINKDVSAPMQNGTRTKRSISMTLLGAG